MSNSIVIFDEAHNVERVCEDSASAELSVTEIASAMSELAYILEEMKNMPEEDNEDDGFSNPFRDNDAFGSAGADKYGHDKPNLDVGGNMPATIDELKELTLALKALEEELDKIKFDPKIGVTHKSTFVFDLLTKCHINEQNKHNFFEVLQRILQYFGAQPSNPRHHNGASLAKFNEFLQTVFSETKASEVPTDSKKKIGKINNCYKVHIKQDMQKGRTICYWCLSPGYSMQDLVAEGARCIILTSGTLSPISSFKEDMKIPFDVILENPHIIEESQIKVLSLCKGPNNVTLDSTYKNRDSAPYLNSLGQLIINFAKIIPHGLLIFFPSYRALDSTTEFWRKGNLWKEMGDTKMIFMESKGAKECNDTVAKYYERIKDTRSRGAIMFAVCRGKISEGIDFANDNGRAVIVIGLPFPMHLDPRVILKRQYLDENKVSSGQLWYNQQTYRAVNQAIGRVIRHKSDYGAILLCDERFTQNGSISQLPGWMRPHIKKLNDSSLANAELQKFFNIAIENFPVPAPKVPSLKSNSTIMQARNSNKTGNNILDTTNYMENLASAYGSQAYASDKPVSSKNFYDALNKCGPSASGPDFHIPDLNACSQKTQEGYKAILEKRRLEEARKNPNAKCKVVVKSTVTVGEAKTSSMASSKALMEKVTKALKPDDFKKFKAAIASFSQARKAQNKTGMVTHYKELRAIFEFDLKFFREIETFIRYTPTIKTASDSSKPSKRKIDECDKE